MGDLRGDHDWELPERPPSGQVWLCNGCGHRGIWTADWSWYGSLKELEAGDELPTFCSEACRPDAAGLALICKRIKADPDFVLNPAESGAGVSLLGDKASPATDETNPTLRERGE